MKTLPLDGKVDAVIPFLDRAGLATEPVTGELRDRIGWSWSALGDRLKVLSDIIGLGRYFFTDDLELDPDAVKKRLKKDGVPRILADVDEVLADRSRTTWPTLEAAVHGYAETHGHAMGLVVNAVRVATTGQGVGPGLYDCLVILGRDRCRARIASTLAMLEAGPAA